MYMIQLSKPYSYQPLQNFQNRTFGTVYNNESPKFKVSEVCLYVVIHSSFTVDNDKF